MVDVKISRERFIVRHSNLLEPADYYRFIHFDGFTSDWNGLGLDDEDLSCLQIQIMLAPQQGRVIPGTGGVRKMRFGPLSWHRGKRGAVRVLYSVFPDFSVAVLAAAYSKGKCEDFAAGDRRKLKMVIKEVQSALERGD